MLFLYWETLSAEQTLTGCTGHAVAMRKKTLHECLRYFAKTISTRVPTESPFSELMMRRKKEIPARLKKEVPSGDGRRAKAKLSEAASCSSVQVWTRSCHSMISFWSWFLHPR